MKRLLMLIGIVALLGASLSFYFNHPAPAPLTYQGKPIEHWFQQLPVAVIPPPGTQFGNARAVIKSYGQHYGNPDRTDTVAQAAFDAFGTNALPYLLARLQESDSAAEKLATKAARDTGVRQLPFRNAEFERLQAVTGLIQLKTLTPEARQSISLLATNKTSTNIAAAAAYILSRRGEETTSNE